MSWPETGLEAVQDKVEIKKRASGKADQNQAWSEPLLGLHWREVPATANAECLAVAKAPAVPSTLI